MSITAAECYLSNSRLKASNAYIFNDVLDANPAMSEINFEEIARAKTDQRQAQGTLMQGDYDRTYFMEKQSARRDATELQTYIREIFRQMAFALVCFCRSGRHPLMWTHYAANNEGIQLEFDEEHVCFAGKLHSIVYTEERPTLTGDEINQIATHARDPNFVPPSFLFQKALEWSYEQEVRLCLRPTEIEPDKTWGATGYYLVPYTALRSITFGNRSNYRHNAKLMELIRSLVEKENLQIKTYHLRVSATEYKLEKHEIQLND